MTDRLNIKRLRIESVMGIDEVEYEPGAVTILEGENESGKTSHLEAILSLLGGKHYDRSIVSNNAKQGRVIVELSNGDTIYRLLKQDEPKLVIKDVDGKTYPAPADYIKRLFRSFSMNPIKFVQAAAKEQIEMLLQVAPITVTAAELEAIAGKRQDIPKLLEKPALDAIESLRSTIYEERTRTNGAHDSKVKHAQELGAGLPPEVQAPDLEEKRKRAKEILTGWDAFKAQREGATKKEISVVEARAEEEITAIRARLLREIKEANDRERADLEAERARFSPELDQVNADIARGEELIRQAERAKTTKEAKVRAEKEAAELKAKSDAMTASLKKLADLKQSKLDSLPIRGVEIREGEIHMDVPDAGWVPFHRLNTARQFGLALKIATLAAGQCGVICMDGLEALDRKRSGMFIQAALAANEREGLQFFVTRVVQEGELTIKTIAGGARSSAEKPNG